MKRIYVGAIIALVLPAIVLLAGNTVNLAPPPNRLTAKCVKPCPLKAAPLPPPKSTTRPHGCWVANPPPNQETAKWVTPCPHP